MSDGFVSKSCQGEKCHVKGCDDPARHKVEETIFSDDPFQQRHPLTAYLCVKHFKLIMGEFGVEWTERFREPVVRTIDVGGPIRSPLEVISDPPKFNPPIVEPSTQSRAEECRCTPGHLCGGLYVCPKHTSTRAEEPRPGGGSRYTYPAEEPCAKPLEFRLSPGDAAEFEASCREEPSGEEPRAMLWPKLRGEIDHLRAELARRDEELGALRTAARRVLALEWDVSTEVWIRQAGASEWVALLDALAAAPTAKEGE